MVILSPRRLSPRPLLRRSFLLKWLFRSLPVERWAPSAFYILSQPEKLYTAKIRPHPTITHLCMRTLKSPKEKSTYRKAFLTLLNLPSLKCHCIPLDTACFSPRAKLVRVPSRPGSLTPAGLCSCVSSLWLPALSA